VPGIHSTAQNSKIDGKLYMYGYRRDRRRSHRHKMLFTSKRGTSPWCMYQHGCTLKAITICNDLVWIRILHSRSFRIWIRILLKLGQVITGK
jgi:hypothetical protein